MKVQILKAGPYSAFSNEAGFTKASATWREVGDVVDYPAWYAKSLINSGMAVLVPEIEDHDAGRRIWPADGPVEVPQDKVDATDGARRLSVELGVDLGDVAGTGKDGRVTAADVRKATAEE